MIGKSQNFCVVSPESTRTSLLSQTTVKTLVVTLPGLQALLSLVGGLAGNEALGEWQKGLSIESIFFPLSLLGLLRLFAAPWLTEDYVYLEGDDTGD